MRRIIIFFCQRWKSTPTNLSNLVKFDVSSLILAIPKKKYHKRLLEIIMQNTNYNLGIFIFPLLMAKIILTKNTLRTNLKMNFVTTTATPKLDSCCRRVTTFLLWYFTHKGTWVETWKFTTRYKQFNTPLVLRVCDLTTKCLENYTLEMLSKVYNSFFKIISKRESKDKEFWN